MKPSRLTEFGFILSGLFVGVARGIWSCLAFFTAQSVEQSVLAQRIAAALVIIAAVLVNIARFKARSAGATTQKSDA